MYKHIDMYINMYVSQGVEHTGEGNNGCHSCNAKPF